MSKLCKSCNMQVDSKAKVCPGCGASLEETIDAGSPVTADNVTGMSNVDTKAQLKGGVDKVKGVATNFAEKVKSDDKTKKITIGVVAAIVLLVVLKLFVMPSPSSVLKTYCKGMKSFSASKIVSTYNKDMVKAMDEKLEDSKYVDYDSVKEMYKEMFDEAKDKDYKIKSYEIDSDYDKLDKDELEDLADVIEDTYDIKASKVKAAREYKVKFKVKDEDGTDTEKVKIILVKIGMRWYVYPSSALF